MGPVDILGIFRKINNMFGNSIFYIFLKDLQKNNFDKIGTTSYNIQVFYMVDLLDKDYGHFPNVFHHYRNQPFLHLA